MALDTQVPQKLLYENSDDGTILKKKQKKTTTALQTRVTPRDTYRADPPMS